MCWMCDHPGSSIRDYLDVVYGKVTRNGWTVVYVEHDQVPFAYTVGLTGRDFPELLVTGASPQRTLRLFNGVARRFETRGVPAPGTQFSLPAGPLIQVVEVEHPDGRLICAAAIFDNEFRALQLVGADRRGRWPWAEEFNNGRATQPVLGMRAPCDLDESG